MNEPTTIEISRLQPRETASPPTKKSRAKARFSEQIVARFSPRQLRKLESLRKMQHHDSLSQTLRFLIDSFGEVSR